MLAQAIACGGLCTRRVNPEPPNLWEGCAFICVNSSKALCPQILQNNLGALAKPSGESLEIRGSTRNPQKPESGADRGPLAGLEFGSLSPRNRRGAGENIDAVLDSAPLSQASSCPPLLSRRLLPAPLSSGCQQPESEPLRCPALSPLPRALASEPCSRQALWQSPVLPASPSLGSSVFLLSRSSVLHAGRGSASRFIYFPSSSRCAWALTSARTWLFVAAVTHLGLLSTAPPVPRPTSLWISGSISQSVFPGPWASGLSTARCPPPSVWEPATAQAGFPRRLRPCGPVSRSCLCPSLSVALSPALPAALLGPLPSPGCLAASTRSPYALV